MNNHEERMQVAIAQAKISAAAGEVPVGAAIFMGGKLIATGYNMKEGLKLATAHAEIMAINEACKLVNDWRLSGSAIYVTAEPCFMCAGAILQARIGAVYYGVAEPKFGGLVSRASLFDDRDLNHEVMYFGGICQEEIEDMMRTFFLSRRKK